MAGPTVPEASSAERAVPGLSFRDRLVALSVPSSASSALTGAVACAAISCLPKAQGCPAARTVHARSRLSVRPPAAGRGDRGCRAAPRLSAIARPHPATPPRTPLGLTSPSALGAHGPPARLGHRGGTWSWRSRSSSPALLPGCQVTRRRPPRVAPAPLRGCPARGRKTTRTRGPHRLHM